MTFYRQPRAFISYRHQEFSAQEDRDAVRKNERHVQWVAKFARDLRGHGIDAVYDARVDRLVSSLLEGRGAPGLVLMSIAICQTFIPILTPGFIERLGYQDYEPQSEMEDGWAFEEWQLAMAAVVEGKMDFVPVVRGANVSKLAELPIGVGDYPTFDFSDDAEYDVLVEMVADQLQLGWRTEQPQIDMKLREYLEMMINKIAPGLVKHS
jgi:hypothetical protein